MAKIANTNHIEAKEERIKKVKDELVSIFSKLEKDTKRTIEPMIDKAAFMSVTLDDLQRAINIKGVIEEYHNGENQSGFKKSVEIEVYNTMIKNYQAVMNKLLDMLPNKEDGYVAGESLKAFVDS